MKNSLIFTILMLIYCSKAFGQVNVPDANFASAIRAACPTCIDASNNLLSAAQALRILNVSSKSIASLSGIQGFTSLVELNCSYNSLTSLPTLPSSLQRLYCWNNQLTNLPTLPSSLYELNCSSNNLTTLPTIPNGMLYVTFNVNPNCFFSNLA